jgi:hypothetical protein
MPWRCWIAINKGFCVITFADDSLIPKGGVRWVLKNKANYWDDKKNKVRAR